MAYTDEQKQLALTAYTACRNNAQQAAKFCRDHYDMPVSEEQLLRWAKGKFVAPAVVRSAEEKKKELADIFEEEIRAALGAVHEKREDAPYQSLLTGVGILTDKMLLLRGQANQITGREISKEEALIELMKLVAKYGPQP